LPKGWSPAVKSLARKYWPGEDAVGRHIRVKMAPDRGRDPNTALRVQ